MFPLKNSLSNFAENINIDSFLKNLETFQFQGFFCILHLYLNIIANLSVNQKKVSAFQPRPLIRLQFLFVFRRIQSLQLLLSDSPLSLAFASDFFWAVHSTVLTPLPFRFLTSAVSAFFRPPQFWILTTKPLFFLSTLPGSASQLLPRCPFPLSLPRFPLSPRPDFSCLPSRFLYSALLFVSFRSFLLRSHSRSTGAYHLFSLTVFSASGLLPFVRLPSVSSYSAFCFFRSTLAGSASQRLSRCPLPLSLSRFPLSLRPDFSCLPSRFLYWALLMVSFHPSLIRSRSCSSGAYLMLSLSLSVFPLPISFLSYASLPVPATQPSVSSFPLFPASPHSGFSGAPSPLSLPWLSPFFQNPVSRVFFPGSCTRLSVRFLSSFPVSLPQPFHRCFPYAFAFGLPPRSKLSFVRFRSVLTTQPSALSFPFFPFFPGGGSHGAYFLFRSACCHAVLPIPVLSFLQFLSPVAVSPHSGYFSASAMTVDFPWLTL